jgi:hypothetical protein
VGRSGSIGLFVGVAAMLKIYPIVLLLWPRGRSRRRSVILAAAAIVVLVALSCPARSRSLAGLPDRVLECRAVVRRLVILLQCLLSRAWA